MCGFIRPPASQVIQQRQDRTGKENEDRAQNRSERPIEPWDPDHPGGLLLELAELTARPSDDSTSPRRAITSSVHEAQVLGVLDEHRCESAWDNVAKLEI